MHCQWYVSTKSCLDLLPCIGSRETRKSRRRSSVSASSRVVTYKGSDDVDVIHARGGCI